MRIFSKKADVFGILPAKMPEKSRKAGRLRGKMPKKWTTHQQNALRKSSKDAKRREF